MAEHQDVESILTSAPVVADCRAVPGEPLEPRSGLTFVHQWRRSVDQAAVGRTSEAG